MTALSDTSIWLIDTCDSGFNGAITPVGINYLFIYRRGGARRRLNGEYKYFTHEIKYCLLNDEFELLGNKKPESAAFECEDPRIILTENGYRLFTYSNRRMNVHDVVLTGDSSNLKNIEITEPHPLVPVNFQLNKREKNWVPFEYQGFLHFIYSSEPFVILKMNSAGKCWVVSNRYQELPWSYGVISGGSPAVKLDDDHYLTFFHSSLDLKEGKPTSWFNPRQYYVGAYIYTSRPDFRITAITKQPLHWEGLLETSTPTCQHKVVFPSGLMLKEGMLTLSYGENDNWNFIVRMRMEELIKHMVSL
jgi:predicted GH43/DUF377 family glycosyl hydrolase